MINLKKCPFCGAAAAIVDRTESSWDLVLESVFVKCAVCGAMTRQFCTSGVIEVGSYSEAEKMAVEAWNIRTEG